jgi:hypothetical protein
MQVQSGVVRNVPRSSDLLLVKVNLPPQNQSGRSEAALLSLCCVILFPKGTKVPLARSPIRALLSSQSEISVCVFLFHGTATMTGFSDNPRSSEKPASPALCESVAKVAAVTVDLQDGFQNERRSPEYRANSRTVAWRKRYSSGLGEAPAP